MSDKSKQEHFLQLYEPVHDRFERFCRARVYGSMDHKDLMNETLLIAFQAMDKLTDERAFLSFLIGISVRVLANQKRKKKEDLVGEFNQLNHVDAHANPERDVEIAILYQALGLLPKEQQECLILFEITGFSIKEISQMKKISESAVKQRLRRGRTRLTEILSHDSEQKIEHHGTH